MKAALYARVSTTDLHVENQLEELRTYVDSRGWSATEYLDKGVSGAKDRRPALDELLKAAKRRKFDVLVACRLDRVGRNLKHLVTVLEELDALGIGFVSLNEGIDLRTPAGRLQLHILAALSEFERARIQERVRLEYASNRRSNFLEKRVTLAACWSGPQSVINWAFSIGGEEKICSRSN